MNTFSLYDTATGLFTGGRFFGPTHSLLDQLPAIPASLSYVMGEYDYLSQRVDPATGHVIDYMPPQPGPRYVWQPDTKRWAYVAGDEETLWFARDAALRRVNAYYAEQLAGVRYGYPPDEVTSWGKQESEARAWTSDNAAPTPLLSAIAAARGVPFDVLVAKVIEKADQFAAVTGDLIGARQRAEDRIAAAETVAEVNDVTLSYGNIR